MNLFTRVLQVLYFTASTVFFCTVKFSWVLCCLGLDCAFCCQMYLAFSSLSLLCCFGALFALSPKEDDSLEWLNFSSASPVTDMFLQDMKTLAVTWNRIKIACKRITEAWCLWSCQIYLNTLEALCVRGGHRSPASQIVTDAWFPDWFSPSACFIYPGWRKKNHQKGSHGCMTGHL